ncbi:hypothetical protein HXX76_008129 [Chlamydomonas incerta]|uniref:RNA helicase n=1 Tax=Chlamydomonas incerta TaxID=51695 RepID=A0A835W1H4_CHLIN|nr:hypothetical protein HXX76_008129 [Chlamydomonas incerta]|eukprot:KAG2433768.1 hypothetical protein HXX76_008129 [Chlamydomonas incerta]
MNGPKNAFALLMRGARSQEGSTADARRPPAKASTAPAPARLPARAQVGQLHLDLGQRDFAVATCPTCGMMYGKGLAEEERLHDTFHNAHDTAFRFTGWVAERVVLRGEGEGGPGGCRGRLLCVLPTDPPAQWRKVVEVCGRLERVLGLPEGHLLAPRPPAKVFMWVSQEAQPVGSRGAGGGGGKGRSGRVVGVLVAQLQSHAHRRRLAVGPGQPAVQRQGRQQPPHQPHPHPSPGGHSSAAGAPATQSQSQAQVLTRTQQSQAQAGGPDAAAAVAPWAQVDLEAEAESESGSRAAAEAGGGGGVQAAEGGHDTRAAKRPRVGATAELPGPSTAAAVSTIIGSAAAQGARQEAGMARGPAAAAATGSAAASAPAAAGAAARAVLGVRGVWVEPGCRRRGIARRMLDAARACMVPGFLAARAEVAFSACAAAAAAGEPDGGAAFAALAGAYGRDGGAGAGMGTSRAGTQGAAAAVTAALRSGGEDQWALLYDEDGDATKARCLAHKSHEDVRAWLAARPDDYLLVGGDEVLVVTAVRDGTEPTVPPGTRKRITRGAKRCLRCETCRITTDTAGAMHAHICSRRHLDAVSRLTLSDVHRVLSAYRTRDTADLQFCELCSEWLPNPNELKLHLRSRYHAVRQCAMLLRGGDLLGANAGGVVISTLPDPLPALEPGTAADYDFTITNLSGAVQSLARVRLLQPVDGLQLHDAHGVSGAGAGPAPAAGVSLPHGASYSVTVRLAPRFRGVMRGVVVFEFGSGAQAVRAVHAVCADADTQAEMDARAAAGGGAQQLRGRRRRRLEPQNDDIVPGEAPAGADEHGARSGAAAAGRPPRLERPIGHHPVPGEVRSLVERCQWAELERRLCKAAGGEEAVAEAAAEAAAAAAGGRCVEAAAKAAALASRMSSVRSYAERLKLLMWLEELQHEVDVRTYDMKGAQLRETSGKRLLALQVPGLAENRPSVLKGDSIYVKPSDGSSGGREWEGVVHVVEKEEVLLGFAASFRHGGTWIQGRPFDVRFAVNRSLFNKLQAVLNRTADGDLNPLLLLPGSAAAPRLPPPPPDLPPDGPDADWLHPPPLEAERRLGCAASAGGAAGLLPQPAAPVRATWGGRRLNAEQRLAVREVVRGAHAPLPYIIYGPPGTGKTSTLVEAAVQLLHAAPAAVLLAVAPSNSAADQLMQRLLAAGRPRSEMMRVCAYTRPEKDLPPDLAALRGTPQLNWNEAAGAFLLPGKQQLTRPGLRVVVCTCAMATMLYHVGLPAGHFSHVLVDEAGHAEEPLLLAGLAGLAGPGCRVVMAGDPQQLGPIILSPHAKRHGLDTSLLERLTATPPYSRREPTDPPTGAARPPYASAYITKLLHNYRSHPALLALPSAAFYHGELVAAADPEVTHSLLHWEALPNKSVPLLFHNLVGRDDQEASSPSWFNLDEAKQVVSYVKSLKDMRRSRLAGDDIGVISPYRKQVQRIRALLRAVDDHIKVGSVEEFQGQERRVIIISTVRSSREHMALDSRHRLGFLSNPKRFNVALTRAKALLVVVGCADVLATDPHWAAFLRLARDHGAVTGQALPELPPPPPAPLTANGAGANGSRAEEEDEDGGGVVGQLAASLQQLLLSAAAHGDGAGGGGGGGGGRGLLSELEEQLRWLGGGLEMEGGEMRRME